MASNILKPILGPIKEMGTFFKQLAKVFSKLGIALPKILTLFEMFTDPTKFVQDFLYGIIEGVKAVFLSLMEILSGSVNLKKSNIEKKRGLYGSNTAKHNNFGIMSFTCLNNESWI